jgi:uncharacterized protein YcnI
MTPAPHLSRPERHETYRIPFKLETTPMYTKLRTALLLAALSTTSALAHAVVRTEAGLSESKVGQSETYRVSVPTEKDSATTEVRLVIPAGLAVTRFQTSPGFARAVTKNDAGLITEVIWRGSIRPMEYARFYFQARNPETPGELSWKIYQKYADGSVVAWDDTDPAKTPASKTSVK